MMWKPVQPRQFFDVGKPRPDYRLIGLGAHNISWPKKVMNPWVEPLLPEVRTASVSRGETKRFLNKALGVATKSADLETHNNRNDIQMPVIVRASLTFRASKILS